MCHTYWGRPASWREGFPYAVDFIPWLNWLEISCPYYWLMSIFVVHIYVGMFLCPWFVWLWVLTPEAVNPGSLTSLVAWHEYLSKCIDPLKIVFCRPNNEWNRVIILMSQKNGMRLTPLWRQRLWLRPWAGMNSWNTLNHGGDMTPFQAQKSYFIQWIYHLLLIVWMFSHFSNFIIFICQSRLFTYDVQQMYTHQFVQYIYIYIYWNHCLFVQRLYMFMFPIACLLLLFHETYFSRPSVQLFIILQYTILVHSSYIVIILNLLFEGLKGDHSDVSPT